MKRHASIRPRITPAIIRKRQAEGIAKEKGRGVYKGRKQSIDTEKMRRLHGEGYGASEIARAINVGTASVYRLLRAVERV